jgi:hypothetical protein
MILVKDVVVLGTGQVGAVVAESGRSWMRPVE